MANASKKLSDRVAPNAVTLSDVARQAGVSRAAASMGLRGSTEISATTRQRIKAAAAELGYRPDPMLAALVARRSRRRTPANLAVVVDDRWRNGLAVPGAIEEWLNVLLTGIRMAAERYGYSVSEILLERELHGWRHPDRVLAARGVRGLLVPPFREETTTLPELDWSRYAVVAIGNPAHAERWHRAGTDAFAAMHLVCEQLKARGVRRVGLAQQLHTEKRLRCEWLGALSKEWNLPVPGLEFVVPHLPALLDKNEFTKWFLRERPEVVITHRDVVIDWFGEVGTRVPEDVGVVLLNRDFSTRTDVTGIIQHLDQVGECSVELMHGLILRGETGMPAVSREMLVCPNWTEGATLRAPSPKS